LIYYGISFVAGNFSEGSVYMNSALLAVVELPAYVIVPWLLNHPWWGRRRSFSLLLLGSGATLLLVKITGAEGMLQTGLAVVGKFCIAAAFVVVYVITAESYPTHIRGSALGICNICARLGGILAPLAMGLELSVALVAFGVAGFGAGVAVLGLKETLGASQT
jgi:hypothetical protein